MKGAVKGIWVFLIILGLLVFAWYSGVVLPTVTKLPVTYDGEFRVVGLPPTGLEAPFYTDFSTVTNVVFGADGSQTQAGSAMMSISNKSIIAPGTQHQLDLYIKIDGPVENLNIESLRLSPSYFNESVYKLVEAGLYEYESGSKLFDIPVKSGEIDFDTGVLAKGEYILRLKFRAVSTINLGAITSQTDYELMRINGELATKGDADEFRDFSVKIRVTV